LIAVVRTEAKLWEKGLRFFTSGAILGTNWLGHFAREFGVP
jgi:hypothetical protein